MAGCRGRKQAIGEVPESPRSLAKSGTFDRARAVLSRIGGDAHASMELEDIRNTLANSVARVDFRELFEPKMVRILGLGIVLAVFQQCCGINVVFNYAQEVFAAAGYQVSDILFNIVVTGAVSFIFTLIAIRTVDHLGRRPLMLFGAAGLAITWAILSEIFPNRIRGAAMAVSVFSLWTACFVLTYTFPFLNRGLGAAGTFWLYCAICIIGFVAIRLKLPETKHKSLEQIERELVD
jgi:MFS transporter, SP family, arabinose:H+ symporter